MFNFLFKLTCLGIIALGAHTVWQGRGAAVEVVVDAVAAPIVDGSIRAITGSLESYGSIVIENAPDSVTAGVHRKVNEVIREESDRIDLDEFAVPKILGW